jgi:hypothetical protein
VARGANLGRPGHPTQLRAYNPTARVHPSQAGIADGASTRIPFRAYRTGRHSALRLRAYRPDKHTIFRQGANGHGHARDCHGHNKLSAEDIGKRFLKLIERLQSRQDLSLERVQAVTGLTLEASESGSFFGYSQKLDGGWSYTFTFIPEAPSIKKGVGLDFNRANDRSSDMASICSIDFERYRNALKSLGFAESPVHGEIGQIDEWRYYRGDLTLSIIPQNAVPGEAGRLCVKSIGTLN